MIRKLFAALMLAVAFAAASGALPALPASEALARCNPSDPFCD